MYNPDKSNLEQKNNSEQILLRQIFGEAQRALAASRISPESFRGTYSDERIEKDTAYVKHMEQSHENDSIDIQEAKRLAIIFEGLFQKGAAEYGWIGESARMIKTSEIDDWRHGVDGIIEIQQNPDQNTEHLAIGVDITYSGLLKGKFQKIKKQIREGKLPIIEYFHSGRFKGELSDIPLVVVGVDHHHLIQICRDMFVKPETERLRKHPFQVLQLKQMTLQLEAFAEYAERLKQKEIAAAYKRDAGIVRKILQQKTAGEGIRLNDEWKNDKVFLAIQEELKALLEEKT